MPQAWPIGIHLETSVLKGLPIEIADAAFLQLKWYCDRMDIPLLVPELCVSELVHARKREVRSAAAKAGSAVSNVAKYLDNPPTLNWGKDIEQILDDVETRIRKYLTNNGLRTIATPSIPLPTLLDMAVKKIRPFEETGEKGFRDSVILFTILEYATAHFEGYHLLLSGDGVMEYEDVKTSAQGAAGEMRVAKSIPDVVS